MVRKVLRELNELMNSITHEEPGIFRVVLKWFGLYLVNWMCTLY